MKQQRTTQGCGIHYPQLFFIIMRIKPTFDRSLLVTYSRGNDVQHTEIVDSTSEDLNILITEVFKGRFVSPRKGGVIPVTKIQVMELDNVRKTKRMYQFRYTRGGSDSRHPCAYVGNMSPRQVRIELERAINSMNNKSK